MKVAICKIEKEQDFTRIFLTTEDLLFTIPISFDQPYDTRVRTMRERKNVAEKIEESLVPEIEREEQNLARELVQAREDAAGRLKAAEREAARIVEVAQVEIEGEVARKRQELLEGVDAVIERELETYSDELALLLERARNAEEGAVSMVVDRLFSPEGIP